MTADRSTGEFDLIARLFAPLALGDRGSLGLADDAALLTVDPGRELVVTTDSLVSGVHVLAADPPRSIAAKILAVNASDLAAMGARPFAYLLAAAFPAPLDESWLQSFADGLGAAQTSLGMTLVGGDTVATPGPMVLTVTAFGSVERGRALRRSGARPGDLIFVSGTIGDGALGLLVARGEFVGLDAADAGYLVGRYREPTPRVELGRRLIGLAGAAIDVSDGLVGDLRHVCEASKVAAVVDASRVPRSPAANASLERDRTKDTLLMTGGDDYELLFTVAADRRDAVGRLARALGLGLTEIGRIERWRPEEGPVRVVDGAGAVLELGNGGYRHF